MKQNKKKLNTSVQVQRLMTGGGIAPKEPVGAVMSFMDAALPNLDIQVPCPFGSTANFEKEHNVTSSNKRQYFVCSVVEEADECVVQKGKMSTSLCEDDYGEGLSKKPKVIYSSISTQRSGTAEPPASGLPREIYKIRDEKELRIVKVREAIVQQRELHAKKLHLADIEIEMALIELKMMNEESLKSHSEIVE